MINTIYKSLNSSNKICQFFCTVKRYTKEHEWILVEKLPLARMGISKYASEQLGHIVNIETKRIGSRIKQMDVLGTVESEKVSAEIYSPVDCELVDVNKEAQENPHLVNEDAENCWIMHVRILNRQELIGLFNAEQYQEYLKTISKE